MPEWTLDWIVSPFSKRIKCTARKNIWQSAADHLIDDSPNFTGETSRGIFQLPYSKLIGNASTHKWNTGNDAMDTRESFVPHIYIDQSSKQFQQNVDPVMDFIVDYVNQL